MTHTIDEAPEHLQEHRVLILVRSALIGAASILPVPAVGDLLATALRRGLVQHVAGLRHVDLDDEAVEVLVAAPEDRKRLGILSALGSLTSLLGRRGRFRRLFVGLVVLQGLEESSRAFHLATLVDHYCARHHVGAGLAPAEAKQLRASIDEAIRTAQSDLAGETLDRLVALGSRVFQIAMSSLSARLQRGPVDPQALPNLSVLAERTQEFVRDLSVRRYVARLASSFDRKWGGTPTGPLN